VIIAKNYSTGTSILKHQWQRLTLMDTDLGPVPTQTKTASKSHHLQYKTKHFLK